MTASNAVEGFNDKVAFIWSVADLLRGDVRPHEYGQFVLPFVVLRRLDSVLEPTKKKVIDKAASLVGKVGNVDPILERVTGAPFYNTSPLTFKTLLNDPPQHQSEPERVRRGLLRWCSRGPREVPISRTHRDP